MSHREIQYRNRPFCPLSLHLPSTNSMLMFFLNTPHTHQLCPDVHLIQSGQLNYQLAPGKKLEYLEESYKAIEKNFTQTIATVRIELGSLVSIVLPIFYKSQTQRFSCCYWSCTHWCWCLPFLTSGGRNVIISVLQSIWVMCLLSEPIRQGHNVQILSRCSGNVNRKSIME